MEQNSISEESQEQTAAPQATSPEAAVASDQNPAAEPAAAPTRRRASRRVSAGADAESATEAAPKASAPAEAASEAADTSAASTDAPAAEAAAPKKRVSRARKKAESVEPEADGAAVAAEAAPAEAAPAEVAPAEAPAAEAAPKKAPATRRRRQTAASAADAATKADEAAASAAQAGDSKAEAGDADAVKPDVSTQASGAEQTEEVAAEPSTPRKRNTRTRSRKQNADNADQATEQNDQKQSESDAAEKQAEGEEQAEKAESNGNSNGNNRNSNANNGNDGQTRSSRTRQRDRKRRGGNDDEPEITEDDVLLPIAGILDVLDNYAFVRTSGYLPGTGDVYVSLGQVKKYGLRKGDAVVGAIRQPRENDGGGRQKYNAIVKVDSINSKPVEENQTRPEFADFTPIHPNERIRLETEANELGARVIDLFAPIGKGQRGLIVGPHESGKSTALRQIANAVAQNQPDAHLMLVVIDERPEEVTELQRTVNGEVIASTFDRPAEDHATVVELAIERAKRLVELGHDVVVLIDSLTSLARAYNLAAPAAVRVPAGSLDAASVFPVKRLLSAARNIENGGSLTVIATLSAQADSQLDEALIGELEGVANMQLRLNGDAADRRIFPAVDLAHSSTRHESRLTSEAEARVMNRIRRAQQGASQAEILEQLLAKLEDTSSNVEFLAVTQRQLDA